MFTGQEACRTSCVSAYSRIPSSLGWRNIKPSAPAPSVGGAASTERSTSLPSLVLVRVVCSFKSLLGRERARARRLTEGSLTPSGRGRPPFGPRLIVGWGRSCHELTCTGIASGTTCAVRCCIGRSGERLAADDPMTIPDGRDGALRRLEHGRQFAQRAADARAGQTVVGCRLPKVCRLHCRHGTVVEPTKRVVAAAPAAVRRHECDRLGRG